MKESVHRVPSSTCNRKFLKIAIYQLQLSGLRASPYSENGVSKWLVVPFSYDIDYTKLCFVV